MKTVNYLGLVLLQVVLLNPAYGVPCSVSSTGLDEAEKQTLAFMIEEEKLAGDVYENLFEAYGAKVFSNISGSERQHEQALRAVWSKKYPSEIVGRLGLGEFLNSDLQAMYDQLLWMGSAGLVNAYEVGALIEETDIVDLQEAIENSGDSGLNCVYSNLLTGSKNHLRAFTSQISAEGESYDPVVLPADELSAIIDRGSNKGKLKNKKRKKIARKKEKKSPKKKRAVKSKSRQARGRGRS